MFVTIIAIIEIEKSFSFEINKIENIILFKLNILFYFFATEIRMFERSQMHDVIATCVLVVSHSFCTANAQYSTHFKQSASIKYQIKLYSVAMTRRQIKRERGTQEVMSDSVQASTIIFLSQTSSGDTEVNHNAVVNDNEGTTNEQGEIQVTHS